MALSQQNQRCQDQSSKGGASAGHYPPFFFAAPRSLYVHVPFCRHRCGYCNFSVATGRSNWIPRYINALAKELATRARMHSNHRPSLQTLYIGGGTPSLLPMDEFARLVHEIEQHWDLSKLGEFTLEANPHDLLDDKPAEFKQLGVNRLSIGVQSFQDAKLRSLDRDHSANDAIQAIESAQRWFDNISIDLIFSAPQETEQQWRSDIKTAAQFAVQHVSSYGLTYEKGTRFWNSLQQGKLSQAEENVFIKLYRLAIDSFSHVGLEHYEISSFARQDFRSQHNQAYWTGEPYEAIGTGAARFTCGVRETNHRSPLTYMRRVEAEGQAVVERDEPAYQERFRELFVLHLRRIEGVSCTEFERRFCCRLTELFPSHLDQLVEAGMLMRSGDTLQLTTDGLLLSDSVMGHLLTDR